MSRTNDNQLNIVSSIAALETSVSIFVEEFKREREEGAKDRRETRETLSAMSAAVRMLTTKVDEITPSVREYQEQRAQQRGMLKLGYFLRGASYMAAGFLGAFFHKAWP